MFRLLTFNGQTRRQSSLLPQLEVLVMNGGLHGVGNDVIVEFLESRGAEWGTQDLSQSQNHTGRTGTLKSVKLNDCDDSCQHGKGRLWRFQPTLGICAYLMASGARHVDLTTFF